ncbi:Receptor kinase [Quillaja saponaria]|uniref:non-specific serine/threonine protein kinase n=1 Tax=Quillaja saponaria TaxID=32244 RepID=A0AAD7KX91_QUISA|nr:Receptor kinase [Quillaja saponaria]
MQISLNFSYNYLDGIIPDELGTLEMVQAIDISNNKLSGIIPKILAGCKNLRNLDLSGNKLSGPIPVEAFTKLNLLERLNLSRNTLEDQIPENLENLKHLISLDLSQNNLRGIIPESLTHISTLKHLNLSFNQLEGHVPETGIFKHITASNLMGNPVLCGTEFLGPCSNAGSHHLSKKSKLILVVLGFISVLLVLVFLILVLNRYAKKTKLEGAENPEPLNASALTLKRFNLGELENATDVFNKDKIIGSSSLSTVYKGELEDGQVVAVKKLNLQQFSAESDKCFKREVKTLSQLRHRNLVKVLGYAWESGKAKDLVLEYMENGNLESVIHDTGTDQSRWILLERINVFISIASGLEYLHSGYDFPIVHCDLKPSNILLDREWEAHVSDFGTARMLGIHQQDGASLSSSTAFEGTIGYLAPEFAYMRKVTTKVDIFSFGIIVMEFLTKRRPTGLAEEDGLPISLPQLAKKAFLNGIQGLVQVLDPVLTWNVSKEHEILEELFKLALSCTLPNPDDRPNMNEVLSTLLKMKRSEKVPQITILSMPGNDKHCRSTSAALVSQ